MSAADDARTNPKLNGQQPPLFGEDDTRRPPARRVEAAVMESVQAAFAGPQPILSTAHKGLAALAVECGRAVDVASQRNDPYGVAAAAQRLQEALTALGLVPKAVEDPADEGLRDLLTSLNTPS